MGRRYQTSKRHRRDRHYVPPGVVIAKVKDMMGRVREDLVFQLLLPAVSQGIVRQVAKTQPQSKDDHLGRDLIIVDLNDQPHYLQIKSSYQAAENFKIKHPDIPVIVVGLNDPPLEILKKIKGIFPFLNSYQGPC